MRTFLYLALFLQTIGIYAREQSIREDETILRGTLDNGMEYYIRENDYPPGKASLRLVVRVGSNQEFSHELGIAHFVEHLVFRGSEHFRDGEVEKFLESIGAWSGVDTNAYTSFDSTVYCLDIPVGRKGSLETALLILRDFACGAELSDSVIEKEREVVLDELYQQFSSPDYRYERNLTKTLLPGSLYASHSPGGSQEVVQKVSPETLRTFYRKWYRPERMAVIAVGDFDAAALEAVIKLGFGNWESHTPEPEERDSPVSYVAGPLALIHYDPELGDTTLDLFTIQDEYGGQDLFEDPYKPGFYSHACARLLQERLNQVEEADIVFLNTYVDEFSWYGDTQLFLTSATLFEESFEEGLSTLHYEIQKVIQHGFYPSEWEKVSHQLENEFGRALAHADTLEHEIYASDCVDNFVENRMLALRPTVFEKFLQMTRETNVEQINQYLPLSSLCEPWKLFLCTSSSTVKEQISEEALFDLFHEECMTDEGIEEKGELFFAVEPKYPQGEIFLRQDYPEIQASVWTLSNGVRLVVKKNEVEKGGVHLIGQAYGGILSLPEEWCHSAQLAVEYGLISGLGGLSYTDLSEVLAERGVSWDADLNENSRCFQLHADSESLEEAFQVIHAFYAFPSFNLTKWQHLLARVKEQWKEVSKDPEFQFMTYVMGVNTQNHFFFDPLDLNQVDESQARAVFEYCFSRPDEFTFVLAGDFDEEEVEELAKTYLASLPNQREEPFPIAQLNELFPQEVVFKEFKAGNKPYGNHVITIPFSYERVIEQFGNSSVVQGVTKILSQRLWDLLRSELGKTYGVYVDTDSLFYPHLGNSTVKIDFTCQAKDQQEMIAAIFDEIERLKAVPPTGQEVETLKSLLRERNSQEGRYNEYWAAVLLTSQTKNVPLDVLKCLEDWGADLTADMLHKAAQLIFSSPYYSVISHLSEE
jgi:zinc protease